MKNVLNQVQTDMSRLLREDAHFSEYVQDFSVTARVKEPYSLWKKMLRNKCRHIMEVPDAIALRIILDAKRVSPVEDDAVKRARERALCYYAQKLCMEHWQPVHSDPRYKDYIDAPKRNGYQSLHYTAHTMWDNEDWNLEIQVRSGEMHQVAEFGLASHWDYKAQQKRHHHHHYRQFDDDEVTISTAYATTADQSKRAYDKSVQEWHWQQHGGFSNSNRPLHGQQQQREQQQWIMDDYEHHHHQPQPPKQQRTSWQYEKKQHYHQPQFSETTETDYQTAANFEATEARADRIRARTKKLQPYIEALTAAQSDLAREHVFVFLTSEDATEMNGDDVVDMKQPGRVLALPAGACVLDALREGEREFGFAFPDQIRLNGEVSTKVTSKLQNGDILTVPVRVSMA